MVAYELRYHGCAGVALLLTVQELDSANSSGRSKLLRTLRGLANMHGKIIVLAVLGAVGLALGLIATQPPDLRQLRLTRMILLPVLLCSLFSACTNWGPGFGDKALAIVLFGASCVGLILAVIPCASWVYGARTRKTLLRLDAIPIDEDIHMEPVRNLVHEEKFESACTRLEGLVKTYRADFPALLLLAQLSTQLKKQDQAQQCLLLMLRIAPTDEDQLTALRLYHQLTAG